jgi:RHS repeat-associated protein
MARYIERYSYDRAGNLLLVRHRSSDPGYGGWTRAYAYDEPSLLEPGRASNRLTGSGPPRAPSPPTRLGYDEQGNVTSLPELPLLRWDYADHLHATSRQAAPGGQPDPDGTTYYVYDAAGERTRKVTQRAAGAVRKSERIYVGAFEVYREYGPDGAVTLERETLNVFDDKHRLALAETRTVGTDRGPGELIRYQLANHLDSSVLELDQDGQIISYEEYYPYGSTSFQAVTSQTETSKRYRYTGKERDTENGFYYIGARYYAPRLGRWTSCDPAGAEDAGRGSDEFRDGHNLFAYTRGNPVRRIDPTGTQSIIAQDNPPAKGNPKQGASKPSVNPAKPPAGSASGPGAEVIVNIHMDSHIKDWDTDAHKGFIEGIESELSFVEKSGGLHLRVGVEKDGDSDKTSIGTVIDVHLVDSGIEPAQLRKLLGTYASATDKVLAELRKEHGAHVGPADSNVSFVPVGSQARSIGMSEFPTGTEAEQAEAHRAMGWFVSRLALHEIGHDFGFGHTKDKSGKHEIISSPSLVMDFRINAATTDRAPDIAAIHFTGLQQKAIIKMLHAKIDKSP